MADRTDDILLRLRIQTAGIETLAGVQTQILALQQRSVQMQTQQAAATQREAAAMGQLAGQFGNVEKATSSLEREYTGLNGALVKIPGAFQLIETASRAATLAIDAGRGVLEAGADMEKWQAAFEVLLGGADNARAHIAKLTEFAAKTPFELPQVIEASKLLESLNLETDKYLGTLGNVASFLDRDLKDAVLAVGNAQRGEFENLKTFGVDISVIMQRAGVSLNSSAKRTTEENHRIVDELIKYWDEKFGGGMERISATTSGRLSNMSDAWFQFKAKIAASGVGDVFRDQLQRMLNKLEELEKDGTLEKWAHSVSDAMTTGLHALEAAGKAVDFVVTNFNKFKAPIGFLVGAAGLPFVSALMLEWTAQIAALGITSLAAAGEVSVLSVAVGALGGPLGIAIALVGGLITAMVFDDAGAQVDELRKHYEDLDETLARTARNADEVHRATTQAPTRETPFAAPVAAVAGARSLLSETYGARPGEPFSAIANRGRAVAAVTPAAASKPTTTPPVDPEKARKAFEDAVKRAQDYVKLEQDTASKLAGVAAESIQNRLNLEAAGGADRLEMLDRLGHDTLEKAVALAKAREQAERAIEERRTSVVRAAESSGASSGVIAEVQKQADARAAIERRALEQSVADGSFLLEFDRQIATKRTALVQASAEAAVEAQRKATEERVALSLEALRFEAQVTGRTGQEIAAAIVGQMLAVREGSQEWLRLNDELAAALKLTAENQDDLNVSLAKFAVLGVDAARAAALLKKGIAPEDVQRVGDLSGTKGADAADLTEAAKANADFDALTMNTEATVEHLRATWAVLFHDLGAGWDEAARSATVATAGMAAAAGAAYKTMEAAALKWFKHHQGTHALALTIAKNAAKEGAAAAIDALGQIMKVEGEKEGAAAIADIAKAIEMPWDAGRYIAAAGKHLLAAAAYGAGAAIASAGAASIREDNANDAAGANAAAGDPGAVERGAQTTRLRTVAGNAPITQNFNVSISFFGGLNLFGNEAAVELARLMRPVLQQMLNDRELTVPTGNGG